MSETIHRKKLFDGQMTAQEVHRSIALRGRKCPCGLPAAVRGLSFAPLKDLMDKDPMRVNYLAQQNGGQVPMLQIKTGKGDDTAATFVKLGECYSCDICRPALEKTMAKLPSWVLVDFDEGPAKEKIIVSRK